MAMLNNQMIYIYIYVPTGTSPELVNLREPHIAWVWIAKNRERTERFSSNTWTFFVKYQWIGRRDQGTIDQGEKNWDVYGAMNSWLVVLTILKNMKVNGKDYPIYYGK